MGEIREKFRLPTRAVVAPVLLAAFSLLASTASAQVPGSWNVAFFLEPGHAAGGTQCIVFVLGPQQAGEPQSGRWFSPTFAGWNGFWIKEGDHLRWYGATDSTTPLGTAEWGLQESATRMGGEFVHFSSAEGQTSTTGAWIGTKRSTSCPAGVSEAEDGADPARRQ
jgi:hypothetical protein